MPEITLTYPVWDNLHLTKTCTTQFLHCTESDLEIVIVDNASSDDTWKWLTEVAAGEPRLRVIHNEVNVGYGPGLNQGLAVARGDYMVALSNDVVVLHPNWLELLIQPLRANPKLLVGGRLITTNANCNVDGWIPPYIEGYCMAFARCFLTEVGFFDERFAPAFVEDVELSWRAVCNGYELHVVKVPLQHLYGKTTYETHASDVPHRAITSRNVEYFRSKVREGRFEPLYPVGWKGG
jgi:GT2 family glycosyltransferase